MERTLVLFKPDALQRGLVGPMLTRFEAKGLKIVAMKLLLVDRALAERHYAVHQGKPFFASLVDFITASPIIAAVFEGPSAVEVVRNLMGKTNPVQANPGTLRGDFGLDIQLNLVHGSDSLENAAKEISLFFEPKEIVSWARNTDRWVTGS